MNAGAKFKHFFECGLQGLRQTLWKEAVKLPKSGRLHGRVLRSNRFPNSNSGLTKFCIFARLLRAEQPSYVQIQYGWQILSVRLGQAAIRRLFSPLKCGTRYPQWAGKSDVPHLAFASFGFLGLFLAENNVNSLNNRCLNDTPNLENLCLSVNSKAQKDSHASKNETEDEMKAYPTCLEGYKVDDKLIAYGSYGAIYPAKIAKTQADNSQSAVCVNDSVTDGANDDAMITTSLGKSSEGELKSEEWQFISQMDVDDSRVLSVSSDRSLTGSSSDFISASHQSQRPLSQDELSSDIVEGLQTSSKKQDGIIEGDNGKGYVQADGHFNLALKIVFNDRVRSNASAVEAAFEAEKNSLSMYHPNIIRTHQSFIDDNILPNFKEAKKFFPQALPRMQFKNGRGRNMLMYLVMHRYEMTLGQYLQIYPCRTEREAQLILCQIVEGAAYLNSLDVVHRDIKDNNILVEQDPSGMPRLVISDFGCSLKGKSGLRFSRWNSAEIAGNLALRAPEIKAAGSWCCMEFDYRKSDTWAIGTLAYQICGLENPFYGAMDSYDYDERNLPKLPGYISPDFQLVILGLLKKDPLKRFSSAVAANMIHLLLWKQDCWNKGTVNQLYLEKHLHNWLNQIRKADNKVGQTISGVKTDLLSSFLSRVRRTGLVKAARNLTIDRWQRLCREHVARMNVCL